MNAYYAPYWLIGGHAQTIYPLLIKGNAPTYRRERWETPDGDFIDLDWIDGPSTAPLVVLFHGLEGSSASHYAISLMHSVKQKEWCGVVVYFRGCSGEPNRLPRAYHSGDTEEIDWILHRLRGCLPQRHIYAAGVSLGGNAALKLARFPCYIDEKIMLAARSLYAFDDAVTAPLHGFRDVEDYWLRASAKPLLVSIAVPTLLLNARNDPFMPASALPHEGGHVDFVTGRFPGRLNWLPQRLLHYFGTSI
jgi:hypothetical protein